MIKVQLTHNLGYSWHNSGGAHFKGYLLDSNDPADVTAGMNDLEGKPDAARELTRLITGLNGCFAAVYSSDTSIFAATDRIRGIPLFYAQKDHDFYLSDDALWIREQITSEPDSASAAELLMAGYVTGRDTLFSDIKQIQAGETLFYSDTDQTITTERYYRFTHKKLRTDDPKKLSAELHAAHNDVFERFVKWADNRPLVVPLSGGYDSRLIVQMLKKFGHENVITYTYGKRINWQSDISKQVAEHFGYQWEFVEYTHQLWGQWYNSADRAAFNDYGGGLHTFPQPRDLPAVAELKRQQRIPDDSILVPGHAEDFIAGSHIPAGMLAQQSFSHAELIDFILKKHFVFWQQTRCTEEILEYFRHKIAEIVPAKDHYSAEEAADWFEFWDWQERQAKHIGNSVRVYEYLGYKWSMPLWDTALTDFWERVPIELRYNRKLYYQCVDEYESVPVAAPNPRFMRESRKNLAVSHPTLMGLAEKIFLLRAKIRLYWHEPLRTAGIVSYPRYLKLLLLSGMKDAYSLHAFDYVREQGFKVRPGSISHGNSQARRGLPDGG